MVRVLLRSGGHQAIVRNRHLPEHESRPSKIVYPGNMELRIDDGTNSGWDENGQLTFMRYLKSSDHSLIRPFQYSYDDFGNRT